MLFPYPADALASNWLNSEVINVLIEGMDAIDAGGMPAAWPGCVSAERRLALEPRRGLKRHLEDFWASYEQLSGGEKKTIRDSIARQTDLPGVYSDNNPCPVSDDFPAQVRGITKTLFDYLFNLLGEIKDGDKCIRDIQYATVYYGGCRLCPFCGLNYFRAPEAPRHALDHLMDKQRYPFSAADLRNLPPTCHECNSHFKGTSDILHRENGTRRRCSDPYSGPVFEVSLRASKFVEVDGRTLPQWKVDFIGGQSEQAETWDAVYKVKTRYCRDVLDKDFLSWLGHFSRWYTRTFGKGTTAIEVAGQLPNYIDGVIQDGFADRAFLKAEAFRFVHSSCNDPEGGDDIREWLRNFVEYST